MPASGRTGMHRHPLDVIGRGVGRFRVQHVPHGDGEPLREPMRRKTAVFGLPVVHPVWTTPSPTPQGRGRPLSRFGSCPHSMLTRRYAACPNERERPKTRRGKCRTRKTRKRPSGRLAGQWSLRCAQGLSRPAMARITGQTSHGEERDRPGFCRLLFRTFDDRRRVRAHAQRRRMTPLLRR